MSPVVVTGMGFATPSGVGLEALKRYLALEHREVPPYRPDAYVDSNRLRRMDPLSAAAVSASKLALSAADLSPSDEGGIAFGTTWGSCVTMRRYVARMVELGMGRTNPLDFPDSVDGAAAAHVAMDLGLLGPSTTHLGPLSAEMAWVQGMLDLRSHRAGWMLIGAGDMGGGDLLEHAGASPGHREAEGVAMLVLETWDRALARGAKIYAVVRGVGVATDPSCHPHRKTSDWQVPAAAMRQALVSGRVNVSDVDLLSISGTDPEVEAGRRVLGFATASTQAGVRGGHCGSSIARLGAGCMTLCGDLPSLGREMTMVATPGRDRWAREVALAGSHVSGNGQERPRGKRVLLHTNLAQGGQSVCVALGEP